MAWAMSKEESSRQGIPERTSRVASPHPSTVLIQTAQVTASHDGWCCILHWHGHQQLHPCNYIGNDQKQEYLAVFLEIWRLSKILQLAESPDCFSKTVEFSPTDNLLRPSLLLWIPKSQRILKQKKKKIWDKKQIKFKQVTLSFISAIISILSTYLESLCVLCVGNTCTSTTVNQTTSVIHFECQWLFQFFFPQHPQT